MPNKNNVDKKISYANGDDNVIPMGPIPHEKPWYETDEGKKLIAKSDRAELISILGGLTGQSESYFKKMKTKDLIDELQRFADFKMAMKEGGLITNYKEELRKPWQINQK